MEEMQEILKAEATLLTATIRRSAAQLEVLKPFYKSRSFTHLLLKSFSNILFGTKRQPKLW